MIYVFSNLVKAVPGKQYSLNNLISHLCTTVPESFLNLQQVWASCAASWSSPSCHHPTLIALISEAFDTSERRRRAGSCDSAAEMVQCGSPAVASKGIMEWNCTQSRFSARKLASLCHCVCSIGRLRRGHLSFWLSCRASYEGGEQGVGRAGFISKRKWTNFRPLAKRDTQCKLFNLTFFFQRLLSLKLSTIQMGSGGHCSAASPLSLWHSSPPPHPFSFLISLWHLSHFPGLCPHPYIRLR